jgi:ABC-type multidrug transport system fused ATPase/permease subunit
MGYRVSGGELQRLSIARELAYKPKILFLDEATVSIDAAGESEILECLKNACHEWNISVVFITHYLSTLRFANLVYVIKDGCIHDSGKPDELAKTCQLFKDLFCNQKERGIEAITKQSMRLTVPQYNSDIK